MKSSVKWLLSFGLVALLGIVSSKTYPLIRPETAEEKNKKANEEAESYRKGFAKPLPGPYLAEGDPNELQFEKLDLGFGKVISTSENGDILYRSYGDKLVEFPFKDSSGFQRTAVRLDNPVIKFRRNSGVIQVFPDSASIIINRSGNIVEKTFVDDILTIKLDGRVAFDTKQMPKSNLGGGYEGYSFTKDGLFSDYGMKYSFLFDKNFHPVPINESFSQIYDLHPNLESTGLGTISTWYGGSPESHGYNLVTFHDGTANSYQLPKDVKQPIILPTRDFAIVSGGYHSPSQVYRFNGKAFSVLPIPKGAVHQSVWGANSQGELLIDVLRSNPSTRGRFSYAYDKESIFVSNGRAYPLTDIIKRFGLLRAKNESFTDVNYLDERGNILITDSTDSYPRMFLLRRLK